MGTRKGNAILSTIGTRLLKIERALRSGDRTMADLRSVTGASLATTKRDFVLLREELGAPIVYDRWRQAYRLTGEWPGVLAAAIPRLDAQSEPVAKAA